MGLTISATNVKVLGPGIWGLQMPPHEVRLFGGSPATGGNRSVLLIKDCVFDAAAETLSFDLSDVVPLNVGTMADAIAISSSEQGGRSVRNSKDVQNGASVPYGPGDRQFLEMVTSSLPTAMQSAAQQLLAGVRERSPGDLKRGQSRNFSETPDNFWYVIVQPRVSQLSITVRGPVEHFRPFAKLPIKDDRGNTLFKISGEADVPAALEIIFRAKRKR
ncbi:hypothetical protein [Mesorhizobium sp.]|uniref:hypothetical protein n=1 Tax=Mesorhizobium sp. TaxID=1871066 RepID=UPI00121C4361|nr:hypothetical protein [Mesorhizobium sp.]TIN25727.1 MAG: hypothetical protein E5Y19_16975 [Mesorhizobium sp.]TJU75690.1 MAG: hypothetical protein E5Y15_29535 [Mesorhizobium sp.]